MSITPVGPVREIDPGGTASLTNPAVAIAANGDYAAVWVEDGSLGRDLYCQRFYADGTTKGSRIVVDTSFSNEDVRYPDIAMADDGSFVVVWQDEYTELTMPTRTTVEFSAYDHNGNRTTPLHSYVPTEYASDDHTAPAVAMNQYGDQFVVAWTHWWSSTDPDIRSRAFTRVGSEWIEYQADHAVANSTRWETAADVAMDGLGNYVVAWQEQDSGGDYDVFCRGWNHVNDPLFGRTQVNTIDGERPQTSPQVAMPRHSHWFVVAWNHAYSSSDQDVYAQKFDFLGGKRGIETPVAYSGQDEYLAGLTAGGDFWLAGLGVFEPGGTVTPKAVAFQHQASGDNLRIGTVDFSQSSLDVGDGDVAMNENGRVATVVRHWDASAVRGRVMHRPFQIGLTQIGVWRNGWFSLDMNGNGQWDSGVDQSYRFGRSDATPIIGDWNGDGVSHIGTWRNGWFSLDMNGNGQWDSGVDQSYRFGRSDATPIIGDWNGDGVSQIGTWRNGWFSLDTNGNEQWDSGVDQSFRFGASDATPIIGDWNGDGVSQIGTWRNGWFSLDMDSDGQWDSSVDRSIRFGGSDATPIIGTWGLSDGQALHAAGLPADTASAGAALDQAALEPIVVAAIADWDALLSLDAAQLDRLQRVELVIAELPGTMLGMTRHDTIYLDTHAAGFGWYFNPTDADFEPGGRLGELTARSGTDAVHRIDLLTAVMHELGHLLGYKHAEHGLMQPTLRPGVRWLPENDEPSALAGEQALLDDGSLEPDRLDAYFAGDVLKEGSGVV